jgi:hypothetical protein
LSASADCGTRRGWRLSAYFQLKFALTVGPLLEDGVGRRETLADAFCSETARITVIEVVALRMDV